MDDRKEFCSETSCMSIQNKQTYKKSMKKALFSNLRFSVAFVLFGLPNLPVEKIYSIPFLDVFTFQKQELHFDK